MCIMIEIELNLLAEEVTVFIGVLLQMRSRREADPEYCRYSKCGLNYCRGTSPCVCYRLAAILR